ncbi:hypothetical protein Ddc_00830 [Ditylenchus destructor]|nr:hypothetical protein Ddc_00830 [Ditylenchus destructor]
MDLWHWTVTKWDAVIGTSALTQSALDLSSPNALGRLRQRGVVSRNPPSSFSPNHRAFALFTGALIRIEF